MTLEQKKEIFNKCLKFICNNSRIHNYFLFASDFNAAILQLKFNQEQFGHSFHYVILTPDSPNVEVKAAISQQCSLEYVRDLCYNEIIKRAAYAVLSCEDRINIKHRLSNIENQIVIAAAGNNLASLGIHIDE